MFTFKGININRTFVLLIYNQIQEMTREIFGKNQMTSPIPQKPVSGLLDNIKEDVSPKSLSLAR